MKNDQTIDWAEQMKKKILDAEEAARTSDSASLRMTDRSLYPPQCNEVSERFRVLCDITCLLWHMPLEKLTPIKTDLVNTYESPEMIFYKL